MYTFREYTEIAFTHAHAHTYTNLPYTQSAEQLSSPRDDTRDSMSSRQVELFSVPQAASDEASAQQPALRHMSPNHFPPASPPPRFANIFVGEQKEPCALTEAPGDGGVEGGQSGSTSGCANLASLVAPVAPVSWTSTVRHIVVTLSA